MWISHFGPEVVVSFNHVWQVAPTAQERATHGGMHANVIFIVYYMYNFIIANNKNKKNINEINSNKWSKNFVE